MEGRRMSYKDPIRNCDDCVSMWEKALWGMVNCNPVKREVESSYNRGYRLGYKEAQKLGISLIEKVIEELKQ